MRYVVRPGLSGLVTCFAGSPLGRPDDRRGRPHLRSNSRLFQYYQPVWAAGGGVNYAVTPQWVVGADYLHYDLGHTHVTGTTVPPRLIFPGANLTASQTVSGDIVRAALSYKF
jgi:hypothetical protein